MADPDLVALAHRSFADCFRKTVEHIPEGRTLERDGLLGFFSGLADSELNGLIVTGAAAESGLGEALDWIAGQAGPYTVWIAEPLVATLGEACVDRGLSRRPWAMPGMVLAPVPPAPDPAPGLSVATVTDAAYEEHLATWAEAGLPDEIGRRLMSPDFLHDPEVRLFTGFLEGRPAGVAVAMRTGATSGIVGVGTLRSARRRGVGAAVTWAAVEAGRSWGAEAVVLQLTEMGLPLYLSMGFRPVVGYALFTAECAGDG